MRRRSTPATPVRHLIASLVLGVTALGVGSGCDTSSAPLASSLGARGSSQVATQPPPVDAGSPIVSLDPPALTQGHPWARPGTVLPEATFEAQEHRRAGRLGMARAAFESGWSAHESPEVALIVGALYQRARAHAAALRWFDRSVVFDVSDFVAFRTLRSAVALGDVPRVLRAAESISPDSRFAPHANEQAASALLNAGRPLDAAYWLTTRPAGPDQMSAKEMARLAHAWQAAKQPAQAIRMWRRVDLRAGDGALRRRARRALRTLRRSLPRARWRALPVDRRAHLFAGLADLDAHAYETAEARMLTALRDGIASADIACETWWILARARARLRDHANAAPAYARFAEACDSDARAPAARYAEARGWFSADDSQAALRAAQALWRRWPAHRLADDARLLAARIHRAHGEEPEALDRLHALFWYTPHGDMRGDAAWLMRQLGDQPPAVDANDRAHLGRLAYFEGLDHLNTSQTGAAERALRSAWRASPSGYYGVLAQLRLQRAGLSTGSSPALPAVRITDDRPGWIEGKRLLSLGFIQDSWWAFDSAGPGPLEPGRYLTDIARLFDAYGHHAMALRMFARDVPHLDGLPITPETEAWFDAVYPIEHMEIFEKWAVMRALPVALVLALAHTESRFNPRARSWAGACGIMQLVPATAAELARKEGIRGRMSCRRLRDVDLSVQLATRYLADLRQRFGDHPGVLAAAYNAGPGNVASWVNTPRAPFDAWVEQIPFHQARRYIKRVIAAMAVYSIHRVGALPEIAFDW